MQLVRSQTSSLHAIPVGKVFCLCAHKHCHSVKLPSSSKGYRVIRRNKQLSPREILHPNTLFATYYHCGATLQKSATFHSVIKNVDECFLLCKKIILLCPSLFNCAMLFIDLFNKAGLRVVNIMSKNFLTLHNCKLQINVTKNNIMGKWGRQ